MGVRVARCRRCRRADFVRFRSANVPECSGVQDREAPPVRGERTGRLVGRRTTDREHRVGNTDDTRGSESTFVLTFGGFVHGCPNAAGFVRGDFEYLVMSDEVNTNSVETRHRARRLVARLRGRVDDQAMLQEIQLDGDFTVEESGTLSAPTSTSTSVSRSFRVNSSGALDWPALEAAVRAVGDTGVAAVMVWAGEFYKQAQLNWQTLNKCVEFTFDPPSDTRALAPNEAAQVRVELRAKEAAENDARIVPWMTDRINRLGAGTVRRRTRKRRRAIRR